MAAEHETDPGFPSGPWTGFYTYLGFPDEFHRMRLDLTFVRNHLRGDGTDDIGPFRLHGGYELDTRRCWWVKTYPGSHQVFYKGVQQGRMITGEWALPPAHHGAFSIWPGGEGGLDGEFFVVEEEPVSASATATSNLPAVWVAPE